MTQVPEDIVDVHGHFFNVLHLPIEGILFHRGVPRPVAEEFGSRIRQLARSRLESEASIAHSGLAVRQALDEDAIESMLAELLGNRPLETDTVGSLEAASFLDRLERWLAAPDRLVAWIWLMTFSELEILRHYRKTMPGLRQVVHHLMDLDFYYPLMPPEFDIDQRHQRMSELSTSDPQAIPFVAYDPSRPNGVELVANALTMGYRGVKFYPPSGYRPTNNEDGALAPGLDARTVDNRNRQLFEVCIEQDVPVFSHCTPRGFSLSEPLGFNAHPGYWDDLLRDHAFRELRLCLAHAGGAEQWLEPKQIGIFPQRVLEMCQRYENVWCEVGHFEEIVWSDRDRDLLIDRLSEAVELYPRIKQRLMFGSDWHVSAALVDVSRYVDSFSEVVAAVDQGMAEGFFAVNASGYLGL